MKTSIDRIRAKITELEGRLADLHTAERELAALDAAPAPRAKPKMMAKRTLTMETASEGRQTVGSAIAGVLNRSGALPLAELAEQLRAAGLEVLGGTLSNTLQVMKKRGAVSNAGGKWKLRKTRAKRASS